MTQKVKQTAGKQQIAAPYSQRRAYNAVPWLTWAWEQATDCLDQRGLAAPDRDIWLQQLDVHINRLLDDHKQLLAKVLSSQQYRLPMLETIKHALEIQVAAGTPLHFDTWWEAEMKKLRKSHPLRYDQVEPELQRAFGLSRKSGDASLSYSNIYAS